MTFHIWRGKLQSSTGNGQSVDLTGYRDAADIPRFQLYGLASRPRADAEVIVIPINRDSGDVIALIDDSAGQPGTMDEGDVCIYNQGNQIWLKNNGDILLGSSGANDPLVRKSDLQAVVTKFNSHTHQPGAMVAGPYPVTGAMLPTTDSATANGSPHLKGD